MITPTSGAGLRKYDHVPAAVALVKAWTTPGRFPRWHRRAQLVVQRAMPLTARALDRLARETLNEAHAETMMDQALRRIANEGEDR